MKPTTTINQATKIENTMRSSSTNILLSLAELNNMGVEQLENGNISCACDLFRNTLDAILVQGCCSSCCNDFAADGLRLKGSNEATIKRFDPSCLPAEVHISGIRILRVPAGSSDPTRIFFSNPVLETNAWFSIIRYNLALSYHIQSMDARAGHLKQFFLQNAKCFYEQSYMSMFSSHHDLLKSKLPTGNPTVNLLCMALCNNMAHIFMNFADFATARKLLSSLFIFATSLEDMHYNGLPKEFSMAMKQMQLDFLLNAIILLSSQNAAPAA
jgi:hypothetical protein